MLATYGSEFELLPGKSLHFCHERSINGLTHEGLEPIYGNKFMIQIFMDGELVVVEEKSLLYL